MTTEQCGTEAKTEATPEESRESLAPLPVSAEAGKAEKDRSFLPSNQNANYISTIENLVSGWVGVYMNHRIRSRTYGGVRGRESRDSLLLDASSTRFGKVD